MNGVVVVGVGGIGVGNGDRLIVFDGVGEREFNGGTGDGSRSDGIGVAIGGYGKGRGCSCCCGERFVVGEDNLGAIGVGGSRSESGSAGGVIYGLEPLVLNLCRCRRYWCTDGNGCSVAGSKQIREPLRSTSFCIDVGVDLHPGTSIPGVNACVALLPLPSLDLAPVADGDRRLRVRRNIQTAFLRCHYRVEPRQRIPADRCVCPAVAIAVVFEHRCISWSCW